MAESTFNEAQGASSAAESPPDDTSGTERAVVVGIHGTDVDGPAIDWGADEASRLGAPLRIVTVVDVSIQMTSYDVLASDAPNVEAVLLSEVHPLLDAAAERALQRHPTLEITLSAEIGSASGTLVRHSERALRLVVGRPAKGSLEHALLGSAALPVVAHAHSPVIVVPAEAASSAPKRIIVGVDGSDASEHAVEFALQTAGVYGAAVVGVLVWHLEVDRGGIVAARANHRAAAVDQRYEALGRRVLQPAAARHPNVALEIKVLHGSPANVLLTAAADLGADMLVLGKRGRGGFHGLLLGSVSRRVVEHAGCVVAVVH